MSEIARYITTNITYHLIFGKPFIMYLGIITLISFLFTASIGFFSYYKKKFKINYIPFKWHPRMAAISIILALIHGLLGLISYF
jgi:hypothetical protein